MEEFNRAPYFDDYDPNSNHLHVLFKDGAPIQTRELNNMQSIMQNQIRSFGEHVFKNGSRVSNARTTEVTYDYIIPSGISTWNNAAIDYSYIPIDSTLTGLATQLTATIIHVEPASDATANQIVIYLKYNGTAVDGETRQFIPGEVIQLSSPMDTKGAFYSINLPCPTCGGTLPPVPTLGKGTLYIVEDGVFFLNGMFIQSARQTIAISPLVPVSTKSETFDVGLYVYERIITSDEDGSLLDSSLGYPNFTAPGADRYQIDLILSKQKLNVEKGIPFIKLASYIGGQRINEKADSEYAEIEKELAKRTYEERGNYTVKPYDIRFIEHKANFPGDPLGLDVRGDTDKYVVVVGPSISYIQGFRWENHIDNYIIAKKGRDTKKLSSYFKKIDELMFIKMQPAGGTSAYPNSAATPEEVNDGSVIELYDGPLSSLGGGSYLPSGSQVGTMKIFDTSLFSGKPGSGDAIYKYYVYDISFTAGKTFADVKCAFNSINKFIAAPVLNAAGNVEFNNPSNTGLIWPLNKPNIKSLRSHLDPAVGSLTLYKRTKLIGTINTQGKAEFGSPEGEMFTGVGVGTVAVIITSGVPNTVDLADFTVDLTSTKFSVAFGQEHAGKPCMIITNTVAPRMLERSKKQISATDIISTLSTTDKTILSKADVVSITSVQAYLKSASADPAKTLYIPLPLDLFTFDNGQTDNSYSNGTIVMKPGAVFPEPIQTRQAEYNLQVNYEYYEHSSKKGIFTVDSYAGLIAEGKLSYETIPEYTSTSKKKYSMVNSLDFRPVVLSGDVISPIMPAMNEIVLFDVEYYLPRADLLQIDIDGMVSVKHGISSDTPKPPDRDKDCMALYELWVPAYTFKLADIKKKKIENKRYTMRDIGKLDSRLKNVEYYTVLNMLEKSAANLDVKDASGYDRFKNGFIVDNFKDFQAADLASSEFKASLDTSRAELRPTFHMKSRALKFDQANSKNWVLVDDMLILPYSIELVDDQPNATKHISINPYHTFTKKGTLVITPNCDVWCDTHTKPDLVMTQDFGSQAYAGAAKTMDRLWGTWRDANVTVNTASPTASTTGTTSAASRVSTYDIGDRLTDVHVVPYIREKTIKFDGAGMAPGTKVYPFFDKKAVWVYCRPLPSGNWGDDLFVATDGTISGEFKIPGGTFFTGEKTFKLTGDPMNGTDIDTIITTASNTYFAGGVDTTSQGVTLNTVSPVLDKSGLSGIPTQSNIKAVQKTAKLTTTVEAAQALLTKVPAVEGEVEIPAGIQRVVVGPSSVGGGVVTNEPIAQSFALEHDQFIIGVSLFFHSVDLNGGNVWVELRQMENGFPTSTVLTHKELPPSKINVTEDPENGVSAIASTAETFVEFDFPVFVKGDTFYAIVIGGATPDTRIWVMRIGGQLADIPGKIAESQVSFGSSFRSQNGTSWLAEQWEDLKYTVWGARFTEKTMNLEFEVEDTRDTLERDSLEFQAGQSNFRVYMKDHAVHAGDYVNLSLFKGASFTTLHSTGPVPLVGDTVFTATGSATVASIIMISGDEVTIKIDDLNGSVKDAQVFTFSGGLSNTIVQVSFQPTVHGILVEDICKTHIVTAVDSKESFILTAATPASETARSAFDVSIKANTSYDVMNVSAAYMKYTCHDTWNFSGVMHNHYNDSALQDSYQRMPARKIDLGSDYHMPQTYKIVTEENKDFMVNGLSNKTKVSATITTINDLISPVINISTLSAVLVGNRISKESAIMNVAPNSANRYVAETEATGGSELFKYVTRKVRLAQPADDLHIFYEAYKDDIAEFDFYYRAQNAANITDIEAVPWIRIPIDKVTSKDIINKTEYEVTLSSAFASTWATAELISSFQIKIVGRTSNSANPPLFGNLRIIALT